MIVTEQIRLQNIALHKVGNKQRDEALHLSKSELKLDDSVKDLLLKYFLSPFKSTEFFHLYHESDISLNEVYSFTSKIFDEPKSLFKQSVNLAKHLYEQSTHPKIKEGEFYAVYFKDCIVDDKQVDAVGLFKSESKETFLKVFPQNDGYSIESEDGININKLDKGCLIFNMEKDNGYVIAIVDNLNKGNEAFYWTDDFLKIKQREDNYFHTQNMMKMCKDFVTKKLPEAFEVTKADQVDMLNKSIKFLKEKDDFHLKEFAQEVIEQPEIIKAFNSYKKEYENEWEVEISNKFEISDNAVKKQARVFKSVIKLDKNFHIYVHGNREYITKGFDKKTGLHFYQIFFEEES